MRTLFLGARYKVQHKDITRENAAEKLKDDIRSKLLGGCPLAWIHPSSGLNIPGTDIIYAGGFYYENGGGATVSIVQEEMGEIDRADIVCLDFTKRHAISTIAELFYAMKQNKEVHVFIDPVLTSGEITSEYWFIFNAVDRMYSADGYSCPRNLTRHYVSSEEEIINIIKHL